MYTPNQVSKVLGNLSRITLPFWTVCSSYKLVCFELKLSWLLSLIYIIYFQLFESVNKMVEYHQNKALRLMDREGNVHGETNLSKYPTISNWWFNKKKNSVFLCFSPFLSSCLKAQQPYKLGHIDANPRINPWNYRERRLRIGGVEISVLSIRHWKNPNTYWGQFWRYQLNSTADLANLAQLWGKWVELPVLFSW